MLIKIGKWFIAKKESPYRQGTEIALLTLCGWPRYP